MSGPSVVVERAPDGWTHIGGPGMHLLIGLDEDDDRTIAASDAADGGDIDDVVEVLTAGGMRKAQHFVGVHWKPRTRIVAFGPVSALVTLADGTEHDVRATSGKVWTDVELSEHPERVVLRVLEESERSGPTPPQSLVGGPVSAAATLASQDAPVDEATESDSGSSTAADSATATAQPQGVDEAATPPASPTAIPTPTPDQGPVSQAGPAGSAGSAGSVGGGIPTFGAAARASDAGQVSRGSEDGRSDAPSGQGASSRSPWDRSWARRDTPSEPPRPQSDAPSAPSAAQQTEVGASPAVPAPAPALRAWTSTAPPVPVRATPASASSDAGAAPRPDVASSPPEPAEAPAPASALTPPASAEPGAPSEPVAPPAPVADDLPVVEARDVDSTWAARPVLEPDATASAGPSASTLPAPAATAPVQPVADGTDDAQPAALPSYDYLFGHTTTADEHRKALAQLNQPDDDEAGADDDHLSVPGVPALTDVSVTNAAPAPEVPDRPIPSAPAIPDLPEPSAGGLISSVPWASPAPVVAQPEPQPAVPTFTGRHTPPPAPSLLPPTATPPPGVRAPEATPLISTGPPPSPAAPAPAPTPPPAPAPSPAPAAPSGPGGPTAYAPSGQPQAEPSFDVPISLPGSLPVPPTSAAPDAAPSTAILDDEDDETELTVDRSALLEARNAAQNQTISGPSVLAVLCSTGHPTPPHSDRCRVCGGSIPPQEPFTMPRPPLGVLRLSTGDVVTLDRSVLLGRAPRLGDGLAAHDRPHVVKVPSPERDVSRNHVEVILEGWHVLIRDLGTTNGTTVTLPGESPLRLRANDQQVLEPGSSVSMADEVSFSFEAAL